MKKAFNSNNFNTFRIINILLATFALGYAVATINEPQGILKTAFVVGLYALAVVQGSWLQYLKKTKHNQ